MNSHSSSEKPGSHIYELSINVTAQFQNTSIAAAESSACTIVGHHLSTRVQLFGVVPITLVLKNLLISKVNQMGTPQWLHQHLQWDCCTHLGCTPIPFCHFGILLLDPLSSSMIFLNLHSLRFTLRAVSFYNFVKMLNVLSLQCYNSKQNSFTALKIPMLHLFNPDLYFRNPWRPLICLSSLYVSSRML